MRKKFPYKAHDKINHPALVMGLGAGGLDAIRSLAKHGIKVYGIYNNSQEAGRLSRYCISLKFPSLKEHHEIFLEKLIDFAKKLHNKAVLIPSSDEYLHFICIHRKVIEEHFLFLLPDEEYMEKIFDKSFQTQLATKHGLSIPQTFICESNNMINYIRDKISYPCIIKPLNSFSIQFPGKNILIDDSRTFVDTFERHPEFIGTTLVQEVIDGDDSSLYQFYVYMDRESRPLSIRTSKKLRQYPPNRGIASYMVTEELPVIRKLSLDFLGSIKYKGIAGLEFKLDSLTDTYYFIEINPRIPWGHALCTDCKNSLVISAYMDLTGNNKKNNLIPTQINGIRWIDFSLDLGSFFHKFLEKKITFYSWVTSVVKANSYAYWDFNDRVPFIYMMWKQFLLISRHFIRFLRSGKIVRNRTHNIKQSTTLNK